MNNLNDLKVIDSIYNYKFYTHYFDPILEIDKNPLFKLLFNPKENDLLSLQDNIKPLSNAPNNVKEEIISTSLHLLQTLLNKPLKIGVDGCSSLPPAGIYTYMSQTTEYSEKEDQFTDYYQTFREHNTDIVIYIGTTLPKDTTPLTKDQINKMLTYSDIQVDKNKAVLNVNVNSPRVLLANLSAKQDFLEDIRHLLQEDFYESLLDLDNPIDFFLSHGFKLSDSNSEEIKYQGNAYVESNASVDEFLDILSLYKNCLRLEFRPSDKVIFTFEVDTHYYDNPDVGFFLKVPSDFCTQSLGTSHNSYFCSWRSLNILSVISNIIRGEYVKECTSLLEIFIKKEFLKEIL